MKPLDASELKQKALESGFMFCGVAKSGFMDKEAPRLENWLKQE